MKIQLVGDTTAPVSALQRTGTAKVFAAKKRFVNVAHFMCCLYLGGCYSNVGAEYFN